MEEGEVTCVGQDYFIATDTPFSFEYKPSQKINWRNISALVFDPTTGHPANKDPTRDILLNLEDLMFTDIDQDRNTRWVSQEGKDALTVLQLSLQYYNFA